MFLNYSLKPFSPHLTIYNIQFSSFFSISHRITGILFLFIIYYLLFVYLSFLNIFIFKYIFCDKLSYVFFIFFRNFTYILISFHIINGLKIILWNFSFLVSFLMSSKFHNIIFFIMLLLIII